MLDRMVRVRLVLHEAAELSCRVALPLCILISRESVFHCSTSSLMFGAAVFWILAVLVRVQWYLIIVLIFSSLIIYDV